MRYTAGHVALLAILLTACDQKPTPSDALDEGDSDDALDDTPYVVPITVEGSTGVEIRDEGTYGIPEDGTGAVDVFTTQPETFTIRNASAGAVVINRILVDANPDIYDEEFDLRESDAADSMPLVVDDVIVSADSSFAFSIHLFPIAGGTRDATVTIDYESVHSFTFTVTGEGAPSDVDLFSDGGPALHELLGASATDEWLGGMAMDDVGNSYLAGHASGIADTGADDIIVARLVPDGDLEWAKLWQSSYTDGHGDVTGPANAVVWAGGNVYVAGATNATDGNPETGNLALVMKIDSGSGDMIWDRVWTPVDVPTTASHAAKAHSVAVSTDHVYVAGTTGADSSTEHSHVFLLALDDSTGETILFQQAIDIDVSGDDVGFSVRVDGTDAFLGGNTTGGGFVMKLTAVDTATPALAWAKEIDSASVNALDVDSSGDVYVSCERGGDNFSVIKLAGTDGALGWGQSYVHGSSSTTNASHVLHVAGTSLYVGGTIGVPGFGPAMGDGFILNLGTATGDLDWATLYFTGSADDQDCLHRVLGLAEYDGSLYIAGQTVTGSSNTERYHGYWYNAPTTMETYAPTLTDVTPTLSSMDSGTSRDASSTSTWDDLPDTIPIQNAWNKSTGEADDADIFWQTIFL